MKTAKSSAPITANITERLTLPLTSPAIYEENWKPMNWKSTTLTSPARTISPLKEKSGEPTGLVAEDITLVVEMPIECNPLLTASGVMKNAPKKLIATETIAKMVRPVTTRWKVLVRKMEMPKITSRMMTPVMALLGVSWSQLCA